MNCFDPYILKNSEITNIERVYVEFKERINHTHFSGTGPSFYSIFDDREEAVNASKTIDLNSFEVYVVPLISKPIDLHVE